MCQLYPRPVDQVDPVALYGRLPPVGPHRPAVRVNIIASADGASSAGGLSEVLGGTADRALFATLRSVAEEDGFLFLRYQCRP